MRDVDLQAVVTASNSANKRDILDALAQVTKVPDMASSEYDTPIPSICVALMLYHTSRFMLCFVGLSSDRLKHLIITPSAKSNRYTNA